MTDSLGDGYSVYKDVSMAGVGQLTVMRNQRGEFVLRKQLQNKHSKALERIEKKARRLMVPGFQQMLPFQASEEEVYFEFSRKNLEDHLHSCLQKDMMVSEDDLRSLLRSLVECGMLMEKLDEFHPSLTLQNIFRLQDKFKLINPYVFDSYIEQAIGQEGLANKTTKVKGDIKSKLKVNLIQTGAAILCMGVLVSERELKAAQTYGRLAKLLLQFQERYSARFSNLVEDILYGRLTSFSELNNKLDSGHEKRESIGSTIGISPPIDFETDLYASMAEGYSRGKSRDKNSTLLDHNKTDLQSSYKRFLGADGKGVAPLKATTPKILEDEPKLPNVRSHLGEVDYKLKDKNIDDVVSRTKTEDRSSYVRTEIHRDVRDIKEHIRGSLRDSETRSNLSVLAKQNDFLPLSRTPQRHLEGKVHPQVQTREEERKTPIVDRFDKGMTSQPYTTTPVRSTKANEYALNNSDVKYDVQRNPAIRTSSAQDFFAKSTTGTPGPTTDNSKRVSAMYNRLNERFKQYQNIDVIENQKKMPELDPPLAANSRPLVQEVVRNDQRSEHKDIDRHRSRHYQEEAYSPFDLSNTKKQIREEREKQYSSLYLKRENELVVGRDHAEERNQSRYETVRSTQESPSLNYDHKKYVDYNRKDNSRTDWIDSKAEYQTLDQKDKMYNDMPSRSRHYQTYNDDTDNERRRNRSVSFNLANTSYDSGRSYARKNREPKSILKKTAGDDLNGSGIKNRSHHFESDSHLLPSSYHHHEKRLKYDDFRIDARYMGKQGVGSENTGKYERDIRSRIHTEPYSYALHGQRYRPDRHYS